MHRVIRVFEMVDQPVGHAGNRVGGKPAHRFWQCRGRRRVLEDNPDIRPCPVVLVLTNTLLSDFEPLRGWFEVVRGDHDRCDLVQGVCIFDDGKAATSHSPLVGLPQAERSVGRSAVRAVGVFANTDIVADVLQDVAVEEPGAVLRQARAGRRGGQPEVLQVAQLEVADSVVQTGVGDAKAAIQQRE